MIIAESKLIDVALKMLPTHNVVDADVSAFEGSPESVNRVCMGFAVGMLSGAMIDPILRLANAVIGGKAVGVDCDRAKRVFIDHSGKLGIVHAVNYLSHNLALALDHAYDRGLCLSRSALCSLGFIGRMLVNLAPAKVGLVHLDFARERILALGVDLADTVIKEPGRFLSNAYHLGKLNAGDAFLGSGKKIDGEEPLIEGKLGFAEDRARPKRELLATCGALVRLAIAKGVSVFVAAMGAVDALAKASLEKIGVASVFVREPRGKLFYRLHALNIAR